MPRSFPLGPIDAGLPLKSMERRIIPLRNNICRYAWAFLLPFLMLFNPVETFNRYQTNIVPMLVVVTVIAALILISQTVYLRFPHFPKPVTSIDGVDFSWNRFGKAVVLSTAGMSGILGIVIGFAARETISIVPRLLGALVEPRWDEQLITVSIGTAVITMAFGLSALFAFGVLMQEHTKREIRWSLLCGLILFLVLDHVKVQFTLWG